MDSNKPNYQIINKINFQIISEKSLDQVITSSDKTLHYTDWLEYYFNMDEDVIDIIKQDDRIKAIIALQAIYYLNIFKKLFLSKLMGSKKSTEYAHLPPINTYRTETISNKTLGHRINPSESTYNYRLNRDANSSVFNVGIIGCGRIGGYLLNQLMILNEKNDQLKFRILVSTRRPIEAEAEVYNNLTEDVEIFLDNERIFHECHLIYLCVQSHQFDNIYLEIAETFKERVEMIKKRRDKIFPTIVSCMAGVGVWKLKIMLGQEVNIQTTLINCKRINDEIKDIRDDDMYGEDSNNQRILKYLDESYEHLFLNRQEYLDNLMFSYNNAFYKPKFRKESDGMQDEYSTELINSILGKCSMNLYEKYFDKKTKKIKADSLEWVLPRLKNNFVESISELLR